MATNIIDAFIVTFGLDARSYKSGERDVRDSLKRTKEQAKSTFDEFEDRGKKAGMAFRGLANEAAGLFLVLAGGASLKDFAMGIVHSSADVGRLSEVIGVSKERINAWQEAMKQVGGTDGDAQSALRGMATAIGNYGLTAHSGHEAEFRALGISIDDLKTKNASEILLKIAAAGEKMDKLRFGNILQRLGFTDSGVNLLLKGRGAIEEMIARVEQQTGNMDRATKASQDFEAATSSLATALKGDTLPALTAIVNGMNFFLTNKQGVADGVLHIADAFSVLGLSALVAWDRARAWSAEQLGDHAKADMWRKQEAKDEKAIRDVYGNRAGAGGVDGHSSTADIRREFPGYQPPGAKSGGASAPADRKKMGAYIEDALRRGGLSPEQARGVTAGLYAESHLNPRAVNPSSGAYGVGQWLGSRKADLFRQYGRNPTLEQQLAFLIHEINGGDPGGRAVLRQGTADHSLLTFTSQMLRPQGANWEHRGDYLRDISAGRRYLAGSGGGTTNIGTVVINTQAKDAKGIARSLHGELSRRQAVTQANSGIAP